MKKLLIILVILFLFNVVSFSQDQQQQPVAEENPMAKFMGIQWGSNVIDFITHFKYKYKKTKNGYYLSNFKLGPLIIEEIQLKFKSQKNYMKFKVKNYTKFFFDKVIMFIEPKQFDDLFDIFKLKYGKPLVDKTSVIQNRMGASFNQRIALWEEKSIKRMIYMQRYAGKISQGMVYFTKTNPDLLKKEKEEKKKAAGIL